LKPKVCASGYMGKIEMNQDGLQFYLALLLTDALCFSIRFNNSTISPLP
jgi:hypothetical protein